MKKDFFDILFKQMANNKNIYLIFIDLGWPRVDEFAKAYRDRAFSTGASEQTALDIAVGLAYEGKIPFVYTITPFLLRGFETIRNYINHEKLNVKMIGAGRDEDYSINHGFSHDAKDIGRIMTCFDNIESIYPQTKEQIPNIVEKMIDSDKPQFLSLKR